MFSHAIPSASGLGTTRRLAKPASAGSISGSMTALIVAAMGSTAASTAGSEV
ncbi:MULTISPECIES: hypothetical protein [unclassified Cryobacterium]|uniref:hypothetical protein n=1 Tax=unclassified Cryobacterium TaxID=2649013 RepID=UPI00141B1C85|nr:MULTISPECIES: hypothetical protein [unclassified Cryobacterium]